MSLLKKPSAAMLKMIACCEQKSPLSGSSSQITNSTLNLPSTSSLLGGAQSSVEIANIMLKQPVMAFVTQRHNLHRLQISIVHAIRKASCRVLAFQVGFEF